MAVRWGFTILKVLRKLEAVGDSRACGTIHVTPISCSLESPLSWIIKELPEAVQMPGMHAQELGSGSRAPSGLTFLHPFTSSDSSWLTGPCY